MEAQDNQSDCTDVVLLCRYVFIALEAQDNQSDCTDVVLLCRFVFIAMEALDQLLVSCHAHSLNLFVESYLKMVQKLLECSEPDLQITATSSVSALLYCWFVCYFFQF